MTKEEFKNTIEYKAYKTQMKYIATVMIVVTGLYLTVGIVTSLCFYFNSYKAVAVKVLLSFIIIGLFLSIVPIIGLYVIHSRFSPIYDFLDNMYVFEYRLKKSIHNKYEISFDYEWHKYDIISSDLGNDDLDYKLVKVSYIKELDKVVILEKID